MDLFFHVTTKVDLYPDVFLPAMNALGNLRAAIVSNADHEHVAAWPFDLPVQFILVSEGAGCYKPDPGIFARAVDRLGLAPSEVLHVGDSDVDDVAGARAAGLPVTWLIRDGQRPPARRAEARFRDPRPQRAGRAAASARGRRVGPARSLSPPTGRPSGERSAGFGASLVA